MMNLKISNIHDILYFRLEFLNPINHNQHMALADNSSSASYIYKIQLHLN